MDFEKRINRRNKGAAKYYPIERKGEPDTIVPMSVADMEFQTPDFVTDYLVQFLQNDCILGYAYPTESYFQAVIDWFSRRKNLTIEKDWIVTVPGVVTGFSVAIESSTEEADEVIIMSPVYPPFAAAVQALNRKVSDCPLLCDENGNYTIDFDLFRKKAETAKAVLFCNPHNPVGRVWKKDELEKLVHIALDHHCKIISDEIWADFILGENKFTSLLHIEDERLKDQVVVCTAASKTFNIAGLSCSNIFIPNEDWRNAFRQIVGGKYHIGVNILGYEATKIAYQKGDAWCDEMLNIINKNQKMVHTFFEENFPQIKVPTVEGTYVCWIDMRSLGKTDEELVEFLQNTCHLYLNEGHTFGKCGSGFARMNVAVPTVILEEALERLKVGLENL